MDTLSLQLSWKDVPFSRIAHAVIISTYIMCVICVCVSDEVALVSWFGHFRVKSEPTWFSRVLGKHMQG